MSPLCYPLLQQNSSKIVLWANVLLVIFSCAYTITFADMAIYCTCACTMQMKATYFLTVLLSLNHFNNLSEVYTKHCMNAQATQVAWIHTTWESRPDCSPGLPFYCTALPLLTSQWFYQARSFTTLPLHKLKSKCSQNLHLLNRCWWLIPRHWIDFLPLSFGDKVVDDCLTSRLLELAKNSIFYAEQMDIRLPHLVS